jgi:hypothetical protein
MMPRVAVSVVVMISMLLLESAVLPGTLTPRDRAPTLGQETQHIVEQLDQAVEAISEIEVRVEARRALLEKLVDRRQELAERMLELDPEELEAVAVLLAAPDEGEPRRALWIGVTRNVLIGAVFFLLGMWVQQKRRSGVRV